VIDVLDSLDAAASIFSSYTFPLQGCYAVQFNAFGLQHFSARSFLFGIFSYFLKYFCFKLSYFSTQTHFQQEMLFLVLFFLQNFGPMLVLWRCMHIRIKKTLKRSA